MIIVAAALARSAVVLKSVPEIMVSMETSTMIFLGGYDGGFRGVYGD
jgi:hypothetical protein